MSALLELAARCEAAKGPDWELDIAIIEAIRPGAKPLPSKFYSDMFTFKGGHFRLSDFRYTASLDAAMHLLPPNRWVDAQFGIDRAEAKIGRNGEWSHDPDSIGYAATPALALCAAALRARAHTTPPSIREQ
jgi:hypothetical protein